MSDRQTTALRVPRHLAIIMDGNGRWAKQRQRPRSVGHRAGARAVNLCIDFCLSEGIETLTLFAFSSENWQRPKDEVGALLTLFLRALEREVDELHRRGVRLRFIGERERFPDAMRERMREAEHLTRDNATLNLCIAAGYGGRSDIVQAMRKLAARVAAGELSVDDITAEQISNALCLADLPDPDLFIRTGGDQRISNFLLWQLAYTELWFTPVLWPDVDAALLRGALADFAARERRFGLTSEQIAQGTRT
jgi:undecaprenyl diphosphate synthase